MPSQSFSPPDRRVRKVLFLEENLSYFEMLRKVFSAWSGEHWEFLHAVNSGKALRVVESQPVDLVVVDHRLSTLDGLQFVKLLKHRYPAIRTAVLTGEPDEEKKGSFLEAGIDAYLEKPLSIDGMESVYITLNELASWRSDVGFRGTVHGVQIKSILQMICFGRSSAVLDITAGNTRGKVYVQEGFVLHAEAGNYTGAEALGLLLSFESGSFELGPLNSQPPHLTLSLGWNALEDLPVPAPAQEEPETEISPVDETPVSDVNGEKEIAVDPTSPIAEMLVCSKRGEILFASHCSDPDSRAAFLMSMAQKSQELSEIISLGHFDRLEVESADSRVIFNSRENGFVLVSCRKEEKS